MWISIVVYTRWTSNAAEAAVNDDDDFIIDLLGITATPP